MTHLELGHGNQARSAEVYSVTDGAQVHRFVIRSPQEALELFRLLDAELGICASCDKPMWLAIAGWCAVGDRPYCSGCEHPKCNRLECPGSKAVSGL